MSLPPEPVAVTPTAVAGAAPSARPLNPVMPEASIVTTSLSKAAEIVSCFPPVVVSAVAPTPVV